MVLQQEPAIEANLTDKVGPKTRKDRLAQQKEKNRVNCPLPAPWATSRWLDEKPTSGSWPSKKIQF